MGYSNRPAPVDRGAHAAEQTPNEQVSTQDRLNRFLVILERYRDQIVAVMPVDVSFDKFRSVIIMAARREPRLLECHMPSLINACLYSAHDGLPPDGRDAAIVSTWNKRERRAEASYRPMVRGLIKQALRTGEVLRITAELVYKNEPFRRIGGSNPSLEHEQFAEDADRGPVVGAYAVAKLKNGETVHEYMTFDEIEGIRAVAQQDNVWNANWGEMARKTVIRRLQKRLPGQPDLPDLEARTMFPQFQNAAVPALPRPTREAFTALGAQVADGVPLDVATDRDAEMNAHGSVEESHEQRQASAALPQAAKADPAPPEWEDMDWDAWSGAITGELREASDVAVINGIFSREREAFDNAPPVIADAIKEFMNDRLVKLTADTARDRAGAADTETTARNGEQS